jgi:hypothetical protein
MAAPAADVMIGQRNWGQEDNMATRTSELRHLEGRQVSLALVNGSRIDDCSLVSAGRGRAATLWVFTNGHDAFIPVSDVVDIWEAASPGRRSAA